MKIRLILLYLLNCWFVCNQTWFDSTALQVGVSCQKIGLLRLVGSTSQRIFKISMNFCPDDIFWTAVHLLPNLVWWCSIMRRSIMQGKMFAIFNIKVTARVHLIKIWHFLHFAAHEISEFHLVWKTRCLIHQLQTTLKEGNWTLEPVSEPALDPGSGAITAGSHAPLLTQENGEGGEGGSHPDLRV